MPLRKDDHGKRWVEMHFTAPGSPEAVWTAMATGAGNAAWFTRAQIEERVGGRLGFQFGPDMCTSGEVTRWEPPFRFGYVEREWCEGAPPVFTEIDIAARPDGQSVIRMIHWITTASTDWDSHLESFESGWPGYFEILRLYLANFAGQKSSSFQVMTSPSGAPLDLWQRLMQGLGLHGADVGEQRNLCEPFTAFRGEIVHQLQNSQVRTLLLRLTAPLPGVVLVGLCGTGGSSHVSASVFLYGDTAESEAAAQEPVWRRWMAETFPKPATT